MKFSIKRVSRDLIDHPFVVQTHRDGSQVIELQTLEDLMQLQKDLGEQLIIDGKSYDSPDLPMIQVYDDYLE